jgi:hypothetical protein
MSMPLADVHPAELDVVKKCLRAALDGPFFPDSEFPALLGQERAGLRKVLQSWPELNEADDTVTIAVNKSFNDLLGYRFQTRNNCGQSSPRLQEVRSPEFLTRGKGGHEIAPTYATILTT